MSETNCVLKVEHLSKKFSRGLLSGGPQITTFSVDDISFVLEGGEILGFLGSNGSGKTTTLQMLIGALSPTSGSISYFGKNFFEHRSDILQQVAFASSSVQLPALLSVAQNLDVYGRLYGLSAAERAERIKLVLQSLNLWDVRFTQAGCLSTGQATRLMLAKAFLNRPRVLLLDEPTGPLDPEIAKEVRTFILNQRDIYGTSIILTSHNMPEVAEMCDRVIIMKQGKIIAQDLPGELKKRVTLLCVVFQASRAALEIMEVFLREEKITFTKAPGAITVEIEEKNIAELFRMLAINGVNYEHVMLKKPTLEDYFARLKEHNEIL